MSEATETAIEPSKGSGSSTPEQKRKRNPIARYDQIYDPQKSQTRLIKTEKSDLKKQSGRKVVLCVRRIIDNKGFHTKTEVDIKSNHVAKAMREICSDYEDISLRTSPPMVPLETFFHIKTQLQTKVEEAKASEAPDEESIHDLEVAANFARDEFEIVTANIETLVASGEITWDLLWAIFSPNSLIYRYHPLVEESQILKLRTIKQIERYDKSRYWNLSCNIVADDGIRFGLAYEPYSMGIEEFDGARRITDLIAFPLSHHPDPIGLCDRALARGCRFAMLKEAHVMETSGPAMFEKRASNDEAHPFKFSSQGRMIVDSNGFRSFNANLRYMPPSVHRALSRHNLTREELLICTPVVLGYCFGNKKWGGFAMSRLRDVTWNDQAFHDLVLETPSKTLVRSMVEQHSSQDNFDDIISGKGKGIICLFSGPPGSGKTLTAEAVAESTRRPLYSVSAGDLGIKPVSVEEKLAEILELASKWNAVLLLDEADVFLQQRTPQDITRNALVSIFLRQLEYYQGILILTTNRIGQCDVAFESRLHISLEYPELDEVARRKIWMTFIRKLRELRPQGMEAEIKERDLDRLSRLNLNGRQIKNIINSARIIAKDMREPLSVSHIDLVLRVTGRGTGEGQAKVTGTCEGNAKVNGVHLNGDSLILLD